VGAYQEAGYGGRCQPSIYQGGQDCRHGLAINANHTSRWRDCHTQNENASHIEKRGGSGWIGRR